MQFSIEMENQLIQAPVGIIHIEIENVTRKFPCCILVYDVEWEK